MAPHWACMHVVSHIQGLSRPVRTTSTHLPARLMESYDLNVEVGPGTGCPEDCNDGLDNDLDGDIDCSDSDCGSEPVCSCDMDGDGYDSLSCDGNDCDDTDPLINPGMMEICGDGIDNDCNALTDDNCSALVRDGFEDL